MEIKRHNLVEITKLGRELALEQLKKSEYYNSNQVIARELIIEGIDLIQIPGIIRREGNEGIKDAVPVGFASPYLIEGSRLRIPSFVPIEEIQCIITPYEVIKYNSFLRRTPCLEALKACLKAVEKLGISLGVWGSAGLEMYTGLPYTHYKSDLDLLMTIGESGIVDKVYETISSFEVRFGCKIDVELDLPSGYGVKLKEMFLGTDEVLAKSLTDVKMFPRDSIIKLLGGKQ